MDPKEQKEIFRIFDEADSDKNYKFEPDSKFLREETGLIEEIKEINEIINLRDLTIAIALSTFTAIIYSLIF